MVKHVQGDLVEEDPLKPSAKWKEQKPKIDKAFGRDMTPDDTHTQE
jgi:hypothetical protein